MQLGERKLLRFRVRAGFPLWNEVGSRVWMGCSEPWSVRVEHVRACAKNVNSKHRRPVCEYGRLQSLNVSVPAGKSRGICRRAFGEMR